MHGFIITGILLGNLLLKARFLVFRIIQLGEAIGNLATADKEFKAICDKGILIIAARQG